MEKIERQINLEKKMNQLSRKIYLNKYLNPLHPCRGAETEKLEKTLKNIEKKYKAL